MLNQILGAVLVGGIKAFSLVCYRTKVRWITPLEEVDWENLRLAIVLNHTSLFEPLFVSAIPNYRLWRAIKRVVVPIADVTLKRPLVGTLFRLLVPNAVGITRKRDETWEAFVKKAQGDSLVLIFPEGRMKRKDGLDKHGKPMTVKGGVADIIEVLESGKILIAYSGGLHHVQAPGEFLPKPFRTIQIAFEQLDLAEYKQRHLVSGVFKESVVADLQQRLDNIEKNGITLRS